MKISTFILLLFFISEIKAQDVTYQIAEAEQKAHAQTLKGSLRSGVSNNIDVTYQRLQLQADPAVYYIAGKVTTVFTAVSAINVIEFDLSDQLQTDSVYYHGQSVTFVHQNNMLHISLPAIIAANNIDSVAVYYQGEPDQSGFGSFVQGYHDSVPVIWTLSEPYGAKDWWPCKQNLSDKIDSVDIIVTVPDTFKVASNGMLVNEISNGTQRTFFWKHRYPIAAYLVCFAVTNYSVYTEQVVFDNDTLPIYNYVYPEHLANAHIGTPATIECLQLYDSLFGIYAFEKEKYGQTEFGWGGGMEHQTMTFVTDFGFELLAHELAHHWFGDKVTCASWSDIWLNESFATYLSGLCYEHIQPQWWRQFRIVRLNNTLAEPNGSVWCDDTTSVSRIFNGHLSYSKGAMVLHQLRFILGDSIFFQALRNYLSDSALAYNFAHTNNLRQHFEQTSGRDLNEYFSDWIYGKGFPVFDLNWMQDNRNHVTIRVHQTPSDASVSLFEMPLIFRFKNSNLDTTIVTNCTGTDETFTFDLAFAADSLLFDPDLWLISKSIIIRQPSAAFSFSIYPNPVHEELQLHIESFDAHKTEIKIYNQLGQQVFSDTKTFASGISSYSVNVKELESGLYHILVIAGGKNFSAAFVKNK